MKLDNLQKKLKDFDWRSLKKFTNPQAAEDLNTFLEKLPQHTNQTILIIAGVVWAAAGMAGLYATVQSQKLIEIRTELEEAQALQPSVPSIRDVAVNPQDVKNFVDKNKAIYRNLNIRTQGPAVIIESETTAYFGQFREAIGHVQNGGSGWRVNIDSLCVGRECERNPLTASLKINKVSVN